MISVTGIFLYMLITCYLLGFGCYELLAGFRRKQEKAFHEEPHRTWTGCVYAGVAFTVFYAQMFSIFYKVGLFANVLLLILAAAGVIFYRDRFAEELKRLWNQRNIKRAMVYALLFLLYTYGTSRGIEHYDTGLYHAQSIRWIEEYGVIRGLGNLHSRLAYNSAAFPWTALYSFRFLGGQSFHCGAGFLAWLLSVVCVSRFWEKGSRRFRLSDFVRVMAAYYLFNIFDEMISPASDYFMVLLVFYVVIRWLMLVEDGVTDYFPYAMLCVLGVTILTMKLSGAVILLLVWYPAIQMIRQKRWKEMGCFLLTGFLTALPYFIRNVLLSGWLVYPFTSIDLFDLPYKIPKGAAEYDAREIKVWGRGYSDVTRYGEGITEWFPDWFRSLSLTDKGFFLLAVSGLVLLIGIVLGTLIRKKKDQLPVLFSVGVVNVCFVFWMGTSPLVRYGCVFLWLTAVLDWGYVYVTWIQRFDRGRIAFLFLILLGIYKAGAFGIENVRNFTPEYFVKQKDYEHFDTIAYDMHGYTFYYPKEGDRTGYDAFPAAPWQKEDILIGETIQEGLSDDGKNR